MYNKRILIIILSFTTLGCTKKPDSGDQEVNRLKFELVNEWPELQPGYTLGQPTGIGVDINGHVFVFHRAGRLWTTPFPDSLISKNTILELDNETGKILNSWGADYFIMPHGLTVDKANNIWVTDVALHQVFKFSHEGKLLMKLGTAKVAGNDLMSFNLPTDVAIASDGSFYVSDGYGNSRVVKFSPSGKYLFEWGTHGTNNSEFDIPHGIALDDKTNVYVADRQNNRIQVFDRDGSFIKVVKSDENVPQLPSVAVDKSQNLLAIDFDSTITPDSVVKGSTIFQYDSNGNRVFQFGMTGSNERKASWFHDIAVDDHGNIFVGDIIGMKVLKFKRAIE